MTAYRLFGAETSPYSLKVRAFLRYKNVDFEWVQRSAETEKEFTALAKLPTVPLLVSPEGDTSQDSTSMLAAFEKSYPEPEAVPDDPACAAIVPIIEDYADEWLNKIMFHQRWSQTPDREAAAIRIMEQMFAGGKLPGAKKNVQDSIAARMAGRLALVGADEANAPVLKKSFWRFADLFNTHLKRHLYLFGGRPSAADFALAGQLQQLLGDPTPGNWLRDRAPFIVAWLEFMQDPKPGAPFAVLEDVSETLLPLLRDEVAVTYLPWAMENAAAITKRRKIVTVELEDGPFAQSAQRYAAKSFRAMKKDVVKVVKDADGLRSFLIDAGLGPVLE